MFANDFHLFSPFTPVLELRANRGAASPFISDFDLLNCVVLNPDKMKFIHFSVRSSSSNDFNDTHTSKYLGITLQSN